MSRFRSADDVPTAFSQARPDRFEPQQYLEPAEGLDRPIDDAPEHDDRGLPVFANTGFAHLKRR